MKLSDKVVVVTGAGSGMGRSLVLGLQKRGAKVAGWALNRTTLEETALLAGVPESFATFQVNITDRAAVNAAFEKTLERFGTVDGVINCAGVIQPFVPLHLLDDAAIDRVFAVNWFGTLHVTRAAIPLLLKRPEAHLVNISSMGGFVPVPGQTIYCASKAAVKLLTEGLHAELAGTHVRVTVVHPGAVSTNIMTNSGLAMDPGAGAQAAKILQPDAAATQILDGMERNAFRVLVGSDAKFLDLIYRLNPRRAAGFIAKQIRAHLSPENK